MDKNLKEIAIKLEIGISTLYKWKKTRKKLYDFIINNSKNINSTLENNEIVNYFNKLEKEEKEMYLTEIKARLLRKNLK